MNSQSYGFSSSHGWMWELDHKEGWSAENWYFQTVVLEKTLESPLDSKKIKPGNPKENQLWIFIGRTGPKAEAPILWPLDVKSRLIGKEPDAGKDWGQEKGKAEGEMVGWHHWFNGHDFEYAPGVADGQRSLAGCSPLGGLQRVRHNWATELIQAQCLGRKLRFLSGTTLCYLSKIIVTF